MASTALAVSASFVNSTRPLSAASLPERSYVLSIAALQSHYAAAASAPSNAIHLFDKSDCRTLVRALPGHAGGITYMRTAEAFQGAREVLLSCGRDGVVKVWDERAAAVAVQMLNSERWAPLLCCDISSDGFMVAAGTVLQGDDASILYWDLRNPVVPLRRHASTHADDITAVHFSRHGPAAVLLSASTDGLLCTSNPLEADEDEASIDVANWGCSISKAGWLPRNTNNMSSSESHIWAVSDMETVSFWSDELDHIQDVDRDRLAQPDPVLPWVTDYIIDCHSARNGSFHLFAGSNEGDIALISPRGLDNRWSLEQLYTGGHSEIVRCILWDEKNGVLLSGGEDAKLNVWSSPVHTSESEDSDQSKSMDIDAGSPPRKRAFDDSEENEQKRVRTLYM